MNNRFMGWGAVSKKLNVVADHDSEWLDNSQRASLSAISERIVKNGIIIADEVGMGKTRIAVEVGRAVVEAGGRVAILVPTGLGFQWQDEFHKGGMDIPQIIRSMWGYLSAWEDEKNLKPWYQENMAILTHTFSNWRMSDSSADWRWGLLPSLYAYWVHANGNKFPRGYRNINDDWVHNAARDISKYIMECSKEMSRDVMHTIENGYKWHLNPAGVDYVKYGKYRRLLHQSVGLGLGEFDLIIIDEAHKNRGEDSGLSRMLNEVLIKSKSARIMSLTATPVELGVDQWLHTLNRIGAKNIENYRGYIDEYASAVKRLRATWSSNESARNNYFEKSRNFQNVLSPYLIRCDKRMDSTIKKFIKVTDKSYDAYRSELELSISLNKLPLPWKRAICAAESLSFVTRQADNSSIKRLRLTMGNGHGITAHLDQVTRSEEDKKQENEDDYKINDSISESECSDVSIKQKERVKWWKSVLSLALKDTDALYDHPAILATVQEIERYTRNGQKVLIFGRYTAPLKALTDLLNARYLLKCFETNKNIPQEKVHEAEGRAMSAALRQLGLSNTLEEVNEYLQKQYRQIEKRRDSLRSNLLENIKGCLKQDQFQYKLINEIEKSKSAGRGGYARLVRAIDELMHDIEERTPENYTAAFIELIKALSDKDDNRDNDVDEENDQLAERVWPILEQKLYDEYSSQSGTYTRLLYGETRHETRRLLQVGFNRSSSFPQVLVAQSLVGREGLNLHEACRVVILFHPEWNPGVVEQQIGRIDRVNSRWSKEFTEYCNNDCSGGDIPHIEVRPVIFEGTYDEYNWKVLRERWDDLRAQLHGIVVPQRLRNNLSEEDRMLVMDIDKNGPNFTPIKKPKSSKGTI